MPSWTIAVPLTMIVLLFAFAIRNRQIRGRDLLAVPLGVCAVFAVAIFATAPVVRV